MLLKFSDLLWILVESKLFFKQPTSWRPRISRDLMISVTSEMTKQSPGSFDGGAQLPVQVVHDMRTVFTYHGEGLNI